MQTRSRWRHRRHSQAGSTCDCKLSPCGGRVQGIQRRTVTQQARVRAAGGEAGANAIDLARKYVFRKRRCLIGRSIRWHGQTDADPSLSQSLARLRSLVITFNRSRRQIHSTRFKLTVQPVVHSINAAMAITALFDGKGSLFQDQPPRREI
jgi:hypothetical protein